MRKEVTFRVTLKIKQLEVGGKTKISWRRPKNPWERTTTKDLKKLSLDENEPRSSTRWPLAMT